jgi:CheY-like chemotaxis protein
MTLSIMPYALVADDDPLILMDTCSILEDAGFRVLEAGTGDEAIGILEREAQNVILLFSDVEMPGATDGFALARHAAEHWPWIEIVIASGQRQPDHGDRPEKATFIGKPFNHQMVIDHLSEKPPNGKKPAPFRNAV